MSGAWMHLRAPGAVVALILVVSALLAAFVQAAPGDVRPGVGRTVLIEPGDGGRVALEAFASAPKVEDDICIRFLPGDHRLTSAPLLFRDARRIRVEGVAGATRLLFTGFDHGAFRFERCGEVSVKGLTIDWECPPHSVGVVSKASATAFDLTLDSAFPPFPAPPPLVALNLFDPHARAPARPSIALAASDILKVDAVGSRTLFVRTKASHGLRDGDTLVARHAMYGGDAFAFWQCASVRVRDTVVHACPGMAFSGHACGDVLVSGCSVVLPPGKSGRLMTSTADGVHFSDTSGTVEVARCRIENTGDDAVNIYSLYLHVDEQPNPRTLVLSHRYPHLFPPNLSPGGELAIVTAADLRPVCRVRISSANVEAARQRIVVGLADNLPQTLPSEQLLASQTGGGPRSWIHDCDVRGVRGRAFLSSTPDVVIENNRVSNIQCGSVLLVPDWCDWGLAGAVARGVIRGNKTEFTNAGPGECEADITVTAYTKGWKLPPQPIHGNIVVEDNTIAHTGQAWLFAGATGKVSAARNSILGCCEIPRRHEGWAAAATRNTSEVLLMDNSLQWAAEGDARFVPMRRE